MKRASKFCESFLGKLTNYPVLGSENTNIVDMLVSFLLVISPLLQHYKGIVFNAGVCVLILCLPYVCIKLLLRFRSLNYKNLLFVLPLVLFQIYRTVDHGTTFTEFAHSAVLCGYFIAIALGGINLKYVARSAYLVAMAAGVCIIVQSILYYALGIHLQVVITELLLEESEIWVGLVETGKISVTGKPIAFYRPSAFFLEPSHMFLYFIPTLMMLLLTRNMNRLKYISATVLSVGLILSTSGMGIALVAGTWLLHLGFGKGKENILHIKHLFCAKNILRCVAFCLVFCVIAVTLPFLRYSILRIFIGNQRVNAMIAADEARRAERLAQIAINNQKFTEPTVETTEAATTPTDKPTEPSVNPTEPSVNPTEPSANPTEPSGDQTEPSVNPTEPSAKPTEPSVAPTEPSVAPTERDEVAEAIKNAQEKAEAAEQAAAAADENEGATAISGRNYWAAWLIRTKMKGIQYVIGVADSANTNVHLPGFFSIMYRYGIIGVLLSYAFYVWCVIYGKNAYRWIAIIVVGVSFFSAHTHGTFYMLFYILMMADTAFPKKDPKSLAPPEPSGE